MICKPILSRSYPDVSGYWSNQSAHIAINAGAVQATSEGPGKTDAGSKRASKALQAALLTVLQALQPSNTKQKVN